MVRRLVDLQRHTGAAPASVGATEVIGMRKPTVSSSESDDKLVVDGGAVQLRLVAIWQKRFFGGRYVVISAGLGGSRSFDLACVSFLF